MHAVNQLHLKDPIMTKQDLQKDLRIIAENTELLKHTNGFDILGEKIGIAKEKLMLKKNTSFDFEPKERENYYEKRQKVLDEEYKIKEGHDEFMNRILVERKQMRDERKKKKEEKKVKKQQRLKAWEEWMKKQEAEEAKVKTEK